MHCDITDLLSISDIAPKLKKEYIDFELSNKEKQMVEKYGYVMRNTFSYFIEKNDCFYRLSEKQFADIEKEVFSVSASPNSVRFIRFSLPAPDAKSQEAPVTVFS